MNYHLQLLQIILQRGKTMSWKVISKNRICWRYKDCTPFAVFFSLSRALIVWVCTESAKCCKESFLIEVTLSSVKYNQWQSKVTFWLSSGWNLKYCYPASLLGTLIEVQSLTKGTTTTTKQKQSTKKLNHGTFL